jgi:hypothetical protein
LEEAVAEAFKKEEPEPGQEPGEAPDLAALMGGQAPQGAPELPNQGPPPMQQLLAGLTGSGNPVLAGRLVRQVPA